MLSYTAHDLTGAAMTLTLHHIMHIPYGKFRRDLLLEYLKTTEQPWNRIPINGVGRMNDKDPDLKYLIKKAL